MIFWTIIAVAVIWIAPAIVAGASAWWSNRGESDAVIPWPMAFVFGLGWPVLAALAFHDYCLRHRDF